MRSPADAAAPVIALDRRTAAFPGGGEVGPVTLRVADAERVLLLGASGSGKSTVLRMMHGAVPHAITAAAEGAATAVGRDVDETDVASFADRIGVLAQDPETGVCLPVVADEVAFPLENVAVARADIRPRMSAALARVGASAWAERDTTTLSGGQLQRVALAAALVSEPRLLLLDEPASMLDGDGVEVVRRAIAHAADESIATVLVEHRLDDLAGDEGIGALPARWIVLDEDGSVRHDGTAERIAREHGRELIGMGCWLPLDVELDALIGTTGGRADPSALGALVGIADDRAADRTPVPAGEPLRARRLTVAPGGRRAGAVLDEVDLEVCGGETVALVGQNGSGKSTLLRALAGVTPIRGGRVDGPRPGLVFQNPEHQFVATSVRAEAAYGLGAERSADVEAMLERFGLAELADRDPHRLSGGQKRRLSIAAMLLHERPHLLADEPGFGLDRHTSVRVLRALREAALAGRGVVFSSHDVRAVAGYADRVLVLAEGGIVADTTPRALLADPALRERAGLRPPRLLLELADRAGS
ncbi:MAG: ABC transporter ATP-binding protein, partial [Microbacterium sp.]